MPAGFRVLRRERKVAADAVERFARLPVANVSDSMSRLTAGGARLRPRHGGGGMAGPALTVKAPPGDNLMFHKAISLAEPGDVIVVDAGGSLTNALMGEMMLMQITKRGVAGVVINGAIRDAAYIREQKLPVFSAGVTHRGPYKNGPGALNVPVAIAGQVVNPGDIVVGDEDGVVTFPQADAERLLEAARRSAAKEESIRAEILTGAVQQSWLAPFLGN